MMEDMKHAQKLQGVPTRDDKVRERRKLALLASARAKVVREHIEQASVAGLMRLPCTYSLLFRWVPSELQLPPGVPRADVDGTPSAGIWEQDEAAGAGGAGGNAGGEGGSAAGEGGSAGGEGGSAVGDGSAAHPLQIF